MGAIGNSEKRKSARDHATKMLNTIVKTTLHANKPPDVFDKLTGDQLCNRSVFEHFAGWLTDEESGYTFRDGFEKDGTTPKFSHLMASTCVNYMQDLMHNVKMKFGMSRTAEQRLFLVSTIVLSRGCSWRQRSWGVARCWCSSQEYSKGLLLHRSLRGDGAG
jgi:hypothetical protein